MDNIHKCSFKHCLFKDKPVDETGIRKGTRYYHKECIEISDDITEIRNLYLKKVSSSVVIKNLMSVIIQIIINKKVSSKLLLFSLNYAIKHNIPIKSPYTLHYLIDDYNIKQAYEKHKERELYLKEKEKAITEFDPFKIPEIKDNSFKVSIKRDVGFSNILGE